MQRNMRALASRIVICQVRRRDSLENGTGSRLNIGKRSSGGPLVDISNTIEKVRDDQQSMVEKRKVATRISVTPFKRPRTTKFVTPLNRKSSIHNDGLQIITSGLFGNLLVMRSFPARFSGKLLTVSNVLKELKYRYDREVNHSHRSALKKILEGDAPPSSMMVLCISSIHLKCGAETEVLPTSSGTDKSKVTKIELTDGWYSVNAVLDEFLSMKLASGKLFVGQKIRICSARLCDWVGPVSPLEASRAISLCLHINGTYRTHWADRLGFCKGRFVPLAFWCIKGDGGAVPCTLVGVSRIYPVLYRERLHRGGHVRSERTETKMMQLYDQRRSNLAEGIMSEFQRGIKSFQTHNEQTIDEGEKLFRILETAAEPEVLMAGMSSEQLACFASYQAKQEAMMQSDIQKSIEKALKDAGLNGRDVTPFMRVRVVGLTSKSNVRKCYPREGLITIWNPTEKQQSELVEGQTYAIAGLTPINSASNTLYLHARGSTTKWQPLSPSASEHFQLAFVISLRERRILQIMSG